jgi:hypothetical protein
MTEWQRVQQYALSGLDLAYTSCRQKPPQIQALRPINNLQKGEIQNMRKSLKTAISFLALAMTFTLFSTSGLAFSGSQAQPAAPASSPGMVSAKGTVLESMNSGGYTYLLIENGGQKNWAAIPNAEVKVGQQVELAPGMTMKKFNSRTLGRTFDAIVFSQGLISVK